MSRYNPKSMIIMLWNTVKVMSSTLFIVLGQYLIIYGYQGGRPIVNSIAKVRIISNKMINPVMKVGISTMLEYGSYSLGLLNII